MAGYHPSISLDSSTVADCHDVLRNVDEDASLPAVSESVTAKNSVTVYNILASAEFLCAKPPLDLDKCCLALGNSYYNPAEFPSLRIDVRGRSRAIYSISLFATGKIQSTGGCRPLEAKKAMMKIGRRLNEKCDYGITLQNFKIQNIVAVFDARVKRINLDQFVAMYDGAVDYEPEVLPAARVKIAISKKGQESDANGNESDEASIVPTATKLRKLMMGESDQETTAEGPSNKSSRRSAVASSYTTSSKVGSYIIGNGKKRSASSRDKDEKQEKEEVVSTNVFSTGRVTFTGAKSIPSLLYAIEKLKPYIYPVSVPMVCLEPPSMEWALQSIGMMGDGKQEQIDPLKSLATPLLRHPPSFVDMEPRFSPMLPAMAGPPLAGGVAERLQQLALEEHRQLQYERVRVEQANRTSPFHVSQSSSWSSTLQEQYSVFDHRPLRS